MFKVQVPALNGLILRYKKLLNSVFSVVRLYGKLVVLKLLILLVDVVAPLTHSTKN
jgi:hypothetical protein